MAIDITAQVQSIAQQAAQQAATQAVQEAAQQAIQSTVQAGVAQITEQVTQAATGAAQDAKDLATTLHDQSITAIKEVAASVAPKVEQAVSDAIPAIKAEVLASVGAIADNVQHDKITQRWVVLSGIQILGQITFAFVIAYLLGSPEAKGIVGWAGASGVGAALLGWAATGFKVPGKPTPEA